MRFTVEEISLCARAVTVKTCDEWRPPYVSTKSFANTRQMPNSPLSTCRNRPRTKTEKKAVSFPFIADYPHHYLDWFLSRVSTLTRDIDITILYVRLSICLSVCPSVRDVPVSDENGLTYRHSFFTVRQPNHSSFASIKHLHVIPTGSPPAGALNTGGVKKNFSIFY